MNPKVNPQLANLIETGVVQSGDKLDIEILLVKAENGFAAIKILYKKNGQEVAAFPDVTIEIGGSLSLESVIDVTVSPY